MWPVGVAVSAVCVCVCMPLVVHKEAQRVAHQTVVEHSSGGVGYGLR